MTATAPDTGILHVVAGTPEALHPGLDRAVEQIRAGAAAGDRRGILITRRSRSPFTMEASTAVPYGTTLERDHRHRPALTAPTGAGEEADR